MPLLVVGSVAFDCIETPTDKRDDVLGGLLYFFHMQPVSSLPFV